MMSYILLVLAAVLLVFDFALNKLYQQIRGTKPESTLLFNSLLGLVTAFVFFAINNFKFDCSTFSIIMAMLQSIFVMSYNIIGFKLLKVGTMAIYTMFLMIGGMVLPYLFGLIFLDESVGIVRILALMIIIIGVALSSYQKNKIHKKQILMYIVVFFLNGLVSIVSKIHSIGESYGAVTAGEFIIIGGIIKFFLAGVMYLIYRNKNQVTEQICREKGKLGKSIAIIFLSAAIGGGSYLLQLNGAKTLPATVLYPFITGGSIVFSTLVGKIAFKEKLSAKVIVSVVMCLVGTIMFL